MIVATGAVPVPGSGLAHRWRALVVMLAVVVAVGGLVQAGSTVLRRLGIVAVPQRYVALSLSHPTALPSQVEPGTPITFAFSISNATTTVIRQPWTAEVSSSTSADRTIARGSVSVGPGALATVPVHLDMPQTSSIATVRISAVGQHLAPLEFHVAPEGGAGS